MSTDRLTEKLEGMDKRREMRARRLSLGEALELAADAASEDRNEMQRWREFIQGAHARGDFRWLHELTRQEFAAVTKGRPVEVYSLPEVRMLLERAGAFDGTNANNPQTVAVRNAITAANRDGRVYNGPVFSPRDPMGNKAPSTFRSAADVSREETPEEIGREVDAKLGRIANVVEINAGIDLILEQAAARLAGGGAVIPPASLLGMLERAIGEIISASETPNRFTDEATYPTWNELMRVYNETRDKLQVSGADPVADSLRRLEAFWTSQDQEYRAISERVVGSPDVIPPDVIERAGAMMGFMAGKAQAVA
jgi:hypothetical protein